MVSLKRWQKSLLAWTTAVAIISLFLFLLVTTPFYSRAVLWALNKVPVTVNQIAAASQKGDGNIEADEQPEPGSPAAVASDSAFLIASGVIDQASVSGKKVSNKVRHEKIHAKQSLVDEINAANAALPKKIAKDRNAAHVIIVLGGGLMRDAQHHIVVNDYTRLRLEQAIIQKQHNPLPIMLSGVEAPFMQTWLSEHGVDAKLLEKRSMNTCENTRFSALFLQKKGGAPRVELVTDAYHMSRARRLFALNGIDTIPIIAPLPEAATDWKPSRQNLMHSRRATYEALATLRDLWVGEINCREVP